MCGIFFFCDDNLDDFKKVKENLSEITETLKKRGPDHLISSEGKNKNCYWTGLNTVLSIRTSIKKASPCLLEENKNGFFAYNGETYEPNTESIDDTEFFHKLISKGEELYGEGHYEGYFAFAKLVSDSIIFGVDFLSEKPLFYWKYKEKFCLSSDIKSILMLKNLLGNKIKLNTNKIKEYFLTRHLIQFNQTVYEDIFRCLPGTKYVYNLLTKKLNGESLKQNILNSRRHLNYIITNRKKNLIDHTYDYIKSSISDLRNRNDVGYIISGGVDSTLISLIASRYICEDKKDMNFFTLTFGDKDPPAKLAKEIIANLGNKRHKIINVSEEEYLENLNYLYKNLSIPMPTHSFASYSVLCKNAVENNCRILVGGEGADEIYNGYLLYKNIKRSLSSKLGSLSPYSSLDDKYKIFEEESNFIKFSSDLFQAYEAIEEEENNQWFSKVERSLFLDAYIQCPSTGLFCVDQVGGLWGLESRSPLANPNAIAIRFLDLPKTNQKDFFDDKKILKDELSKLSEYWAENLPTKQGFSGYPNEVFNFDDLKKYAKSISDILSINYRDLEKNFGSKDFDWKILNIGSFINSNSSIINL